MELTKALSLKRVTSFWLIGMTVKLYTTFVIKSLWNWFAAEAFGLRPVSYWAAFGLLLIAGLLFGEPKDGRGGDEFRWTSIFMMLDVCIPEARREEIKEGLQQLEEHMSAKILISGFSQVVGSLVGVTLTLVVGWIVHTLFV